MDLDAPCLVEKKATAARRTRVFTTGVGRAEACRKAACTGHRAAGSRIRHMKAPTMDRSGRHWACSRTACAAEACRDLAVAACGHLRALRVSRLGLGRRHRSRCLGKARAR